ncbi:SusC/RagA family TonB-linked outer membrane protein [Dinghuibacter silviterrae]|uniref:TonB-linked SusC/RagA family outer membrane protein n=1 Tax=Dinghuibacter silviterrae TaxID=1539049 RepID=A0A4V3GKK8_9BACT|nr:SusC/RagA family TonB-linked outer membrane protein [Dinghuibacter silviterrae]TDW96032.1 TonB-linked SusC/RagA family outer membrane protein [Dinghuibacter silviterrae]
MRVTLLQLLLAGGLVASASAGRVSGQGILDRKISITENSQNLKKVLKTIEQAADVKFTYDTRLVASRGQVSLDVRNEDLKNVLDRLLNPLNIRYEVVNDQIILQRMPVIDPPTAFKAPEGVKGTVVSADGTPLPGVSVTIAGTEKGTVTDATGHFTIEAKKGDVLVFSYVGYTSYRMAVGNATSISITLNQGGNALHEVVITGLGIKRESRSIGYSVQQVSGNDVVKADPPNISEGLVGKVAGMNVTLPNGVEGASSRIVIRGNNSLYGNNQPLIVVDGVMIDNEPILPKGDNQTLDNLANPGQTDVSQLATDYGSFLNTINADDIESVNVLKGPTAAALYGARGANGVILITTKKGSKEKGLGLDYNFSVRWNDPYRFIKMQNEYGSGMTTTLYSANPPFVTDASGNPREFTENDQYGTYQNIPGGGPFYNYIGFPGDGASWGPKMQGQSLTWWDGTKRPYTNNPNIFKSFYKTGYTTTNNVSFSGGGDVGTLRASYTRTYNDAITYNSNYTQNVFNLGSSINVSKKVKAEATVSYININRLNAPNILGENIGTPNGYTYSGIGYMTMYHLPRDYKPLERSMSVNADGSRNTTVPNNNPYPSSSMGNYWWNLFANNVTLTQNQLLGSVKLTGDILPWLSANGHVGINYYTNQFETKNRPTDAAGLQGDYANDLSTISTENLDAMITAHKDNLVKDFNASLSVGSSWYHYKMYDLAASNPGPFSYPFTYNLNNYNGAAASYPHPTENRNESEISSVLGILNLSYKNYLFLEASGRNDWSSTLPQNEWSFFYPSATLSFVFTDAFNMGRAKDWLSYGKVRVGDAGSANGYVPYSTQFNYLPVTTAGFTNGLSVPGTLPALHIQPQRSRSLEVGTDLGFLNNRINLNFSYYNIYSSDQIIPIPVAISSGASQITINTGALRNRGFEFIINAKIIDHMPFSWDVTINGAHNQNKVVALETGVNSLQLGSWFGGDGVAMNVKVGDNYGGIYGLGYVYKNGQPVVNLLYADGANTGNGSVIGAQYATTAAPVKLGDATPKITGGIGNTFTYKNISLYVLTDFNIGGQIWSGDYATMMGQGEAPETVKERDGGGLAYTFPDGTSSKIGVILPGVTPDGKTNTTVVNAWWKYAGNYQSWDNVPVVRNNSIFTNSWGKLREATLTYRLPRSFVQKTKVFQNLQVSLVGRDLFYLFTKLPDRINPESLSGTTNVQGIQFGGLPGVRSYGISVKAGF